jgi:hypothetical protein
VLALLQVNSEKFGQVSASEIDQQDLVALNRLYKPRLLQYVGTVDVSHSEQGVVASAINENLDSAISESDEKLSALLDDWRLKNFNEVNIERLSPFGHRISFR